MVQAIETEYHGYRMRSRLEARWAAFFDRCQWSWHYEPLEHGTWIPDFAIGWEPTFCEVKPFFRDEDWTDMIRQIDAALTPPYRVVCLGAGPRWQTDDSDIFALGWLLERWDYLELDGQQGQMGPCLQDLHFGFTEGNHRLGLCPMNAGWSNVIYQPPQNDSHPNKWSRVHGSIHCGELNVNSPAGQICRDYWGQAHQLTRHEFSRVPEGV